MSVADTFRQSLEFLMGEHNPDEIIAVKQSLFGDFETMDHCLCILQMTKEQVDGRMAHICSSLLLEFLSQETDDSEFSEFSRIVELIFAIFSNPNAIGRIYCTNLCATLSLIGNMCAYDDSCFLGLSEALLNGNLEDRFLGFCLLNFIIDRLRINPNPSKESYVCRLWLKSVEESLTPEVVMNGDSSELVCQIMNNFSDNAKRWSEIYFSEGLAGFRTIAHLFNIFCEMAKSGSVVTDNRVAIACLSVMRGFRSLLDEPTCEIITAFKCSSGYQQIYLRLISMTEVLRTIFPTDTQCQITYQIMEIIRFDFALMQENGMNISAVGNIVLAIAAAAQLVPTAIQNFAENPEMFYLDAYLNDSYNLRSLACQFLEDLCECVPLEFLVQISGSLPPSEGKLRLLSVLFSYARGLDRKGRLSDPVKADFVALMTGTSGAEKMGLTPDIISLSTLFLMPDQLFLRPQTEIEAAYSLVLSGSLLQASIPKGSPEFNTIQFTLGCKLVRSVVELGKPIPAEIVSFLLDRSGSCLSDDIVAIIQETLIQEMDYEELRGFVLKFIFSEILRIEGTRPETNRADEIRLDRCYDCVRCLYCVGGDGVNIDQLIEFWHVFYSNPFCDSMSLLKCIIDLCQQRAENISKLMEPIWKRFMDLLGGDNEPELEDIMRIFFYFFASNSDYISANLPHHMPLIDAIWKLFSSWKNRNNEILVYLLSEVIVFFIQEKWLPCDLAGFATKVAVDILVSVNPVESPTLCLAALDIMISVIVFYREDCPDYDPLLCCPDLLNVWRVLFESGCIVRSQDAAMHSLLFMYLAHLHPDHENMHTALAMLRGWSESERSPNLHEVVEELEGVFSPAFGALIQKMGETEE